MNDRAASRVHYVDRLRIFAVLLLFPFHTLRVFNNEPFYAKAATLSGAADWVIGFIGVWHMPLFFFHQTVIVIVAFFLVDLAIPAAAQWVVLLLLSVAGTFALYEVARWLNVFRFLLGMRWRRPAPRPVSGDRA